MTAPDDWTPERIEEARERCERATPGPWRTVDRWDGSEVRSDPGTRVIVAVDLCAEDAAFISHARADLPAALAEIERRATHAATWKALARRLMRRYRSERRGHDLTRSDRKKHRAEIERLTAELAARAYPHDLSLAIAAEHARQEAEHGSPVPRADVERALIWGGILREQERRVAEKEEQIAAMRAPADASLEARATTAEAVFRGANGTITASVAHLRAAWLAVVRAVDASRPATEEQAEIAAALKALGARPDLMLGEAIARFKARLDASRPGLTERDAADIELARAIRDTLRETTHAGAIERLEELLDVEKEAAARPGLTEEQAQTARFEPVIAAWLAYFDAMDRQNASGTAADAQIVRELRAKANGMDRIVADVVYHVALARHRASRGETGPAAVDPPTPDRPAGLTRAMHDAAQRPSVPPRIEYEHGPDGETYRVEDDWQPCACGAAVSRGEAHPTGPGHDVDWSAVDRQRATLHAGDPAAPDPRVDYSGSMRPAVTGGECAECLHAPPLHERTCPKLTRRPQ